MQPNRFPSLPPLKRCHYFEFMWLNQSSLKHSVFMCQDIVDLVKAHNKSKQNMKLDVLYLY